MKGTRIAHNVMRTPKEKEKILNKYFFSDKTLKQVSIENGDDLSLLKRWKKKYLESGIDGLVAQTGKHNSPVRGKYNRNKLTKKS